MQDYYGIGEVFVKFDPDGNEIEFNDLYCPADSTEESLLYRKGT